MSHLTNEEKELIEGNRNFYGDKNRVNFPPSKDVLPLIAIIDRLSARCEELERENTNLKACNQAYVNEEEFNGRVVDELLLTKVQLSSARSRESAYRKALEKYGFHLDGCRARAFGKCTCGFDIARQALDLGTEEPCNYPPNGFCSKCKNRYFNNSAYALGGTGGGIGTGSEGIMASTSAPCSMGGVGSAGGKYPACDREPEEPVGREVTREELAKIVREKADEWCSLEVENEVQEHIAAHLLATFLVERR